jgi:membrane protein YdbS with pleckstrin-like domain
MIIKGQETHLGKKAFAILCLEKSEIPGIFLVVTVAVLLFRDVLPVSVQPIVSSIISFLILATVVLFAVSFLVGWFDYAKYSFTFEEYDIRMKRGLIKKKETSIPYRNIQDVNIERSPTYQILGLSKVVLTTAGHEEVGEKGMSEVVIEAMDKKLAEEMRDMLQEKIGVQVTRPETTNL